MRRRNIALVYILLCMVLLYISMSCDVDAALVFQAREEMNTPGIYCDDAPRRRPSCYSRTHAGSLWLR